MKNNILFTIFALSFAISNMFAEEVKLSPATNQQLNQNQFTEACIQLFQEGEKLLEEAAKQHGTHNQISLMKEKLFAAKTLILQMDSEMQKLSCDKGLIALNSLKQKY